MATLTGNAINTSYQGLIKTIDNAVLGINSTKVITDGEGNLTPLALAQSSLLIGSQTAATTVELFSSNLTLADQTATNGFILNSTNLAFAGAIDFTGSTVSGLPAGSDTTYDLGSAQSTNDVDVTLTGSDATIDTIKMVAGTNITLTDNGSNQITIDAAGGTDTDTTYDLGSAQSTNDVDVTLTGSDATIDTIKMVAGTNITLTDNGSNQITIDAAGGGGAAGLVSGTGADSMKSAASLTTNPSTVSGANTISLGDNNIADKPDLINIGTNLNNSGTGDGTIMIGKNWRQTFGEKSVLIGHNNSQISVGQCGVVAIGSVGCTDSRYGVIIGNGACAYGSSNGFGVAVGYNSAAGSGSATDQATALGYAAKASNLNSLALGAATIASADGATALGHGVTAAKADTVTVKELEVCAAGGGITIKSPNGTEYKLTVTDAGALVIT